MSPPRSRPASPHHGSDDETDFPAHDSVWYAWTPSTTTDARIRACEGSIGAHLGVYTGAALGALTKVTPTDPIDTFPSCSIRFEAQQGITYRIAIGGLGAEEEGHFQLDIHGFSPPANDDVASAQSIGPDLPISIEGSNIDASAEENEPDHSPFDEGDAYESVWYSWISTTARVVRISTCGVDFSSYLAIYTGPAQVESLTKVAVGKGGCGIAGGHLIEFSADRRDPLPDRCGRQLRRPGRLLPAQHRRPGDGPPGAASAAVTGDAAAGLGLLAEKRAQEVQEDPEEEAAPSLREQSATEGEEDQRCLRSPCRWPGRSPRSSRPGRGRSRGGFRRHRRQQRRDPAARFGLTRTRIEGPRPETV